MDPVAAARYAKPREVSARMAQPADGGCVLVTNQADPNVYVLTTNVSGAGRWAARDPSIGSAASDLIRSARAADDAIDGTLTTVPVLEAHSNPDTGRFRPTGG
jgi:hypothetical protein